MKELYISPELNVICFMPVERIAQNENIDGDDVLLANDPSDPFGGSGDDFGFDLGL